MASQATTPISLLAGPQLVGMFLNWSLQGVLTIQVYFYYLWFPRDSRWLKALVFGLFAYEWVQTGLVTDFAFDNFVYGYGDRGVLTAFHNTWFSVTIMSSIASSVVQCYFAWRICVIGRSKFLTALVVILSIAQMCVGIAGGIMLHVIDPSAASASAVTPVIGSWLGGAALVDIIIAVSMTILLLRAKSGIAKSDHMINRLIALVVETGTLTATVAIVDLICFTAFSDTLLHECAALVLPKLYSNSLLASLNNRVFMRRLADDTIAVDSYGMNGVTTFTSTANRDRFTAPSMRVSDRSHGERSGLQIHVHEVVLSDAADQKDGVPLDRSPSRSASDSKSPDDDLV